MAENLLAAALEEILRAHPAGLSEHQLIKQLKARQDGLLPEAEAHDALALFRLHFELFHTLYRLRDDWWRTHTACLHIHTLSIVARPYRAGAAGLSEHDAVRTYYLDRRNLERMTSQQADAMLFRFRMRLAHPERRAQALATLDLSDPVSETDIRRQYRRLAMRHHPDRGGDTQRLQAIHEAVTLLLSHRKFRP